MLYYLPVNSHGLCACGCGLAAPIAKSSDASRGYVKGQPMQFRIGHQSRGRHASWREWWHEVEGPLATPCWKWKLAIETQGYGVIAWEGRKQKAHRWVFERLRGREPSKPIDHLCRNRWCVNPDHLEETSHRTNVLRGVGPTAKNAAQRVCKHGHPLDGENLIVRPDGNRDCRECRRRRSREYQRRRRAAIYADPKAHEAEKRRWAAEQRKRRAQS